jgi:RNA polymerase sigma factor (sigma-70 family)
MHELDDHALLRQYAEQNSETAFAALVARHVDKVYSTALRHTRNVHAAEEITQAVFVILAKKSGRLGAKVILSGWLYETARLTALTFIRSEIRRARREQEAHMTTALNENESEAWSHIAPLLDDALAKLSAADRHAVVLRYFDGKSLGEVGAAMGASEDAAKKRVTRAVEKLRGWFTKRGVTLTATVLTAAISANSVQAAPLGLAATVTAVAVKGAAVSGSTLTLIKGALKLMAWTKAKLVIAVTAGVLLAAGTAIVVVERVGHPDESNSIPAWADDENNWEFSSQHLRELPPVFFLRPTKFSFQQSGITQGAYDSNGVCQIMFKGVELSELLCEAYRVSTYNRAKKERCVFPEGVPDDRYDCMFTLREPDWREKLKEKIRSHLKLVARVERREVKGEPVEMLVVEKVK